MKKSLIILILCLGINAFAQEKKPNIIMIAIDDLNDWIGVYGGNPQVKTPNIDKLAKMSMVFRNTSCAGPVCGPSRSALLSGFMPSTTGIYGNNDNMLNSPIVQTNATLPEYFSKNGYLTLSMGKIFHKHETETGSDNGQWAFDVWEQERGSGKAIKEKYFSRNKGIINGVKIENPLYAKGGGSEFNFGPLSTPKELTKDYQTATWFAKKLQDSYDKPFFMSVGISKPHLSFEVPEEYFNMYNLDSIKVPEYRMDDLDDILDNTGKKVFNPEPDFLWTKHYGLEKEVTRAYMAAISYADACVGVVLDALAKSKYANNTIIMLYGDHGWHLGEKLRYRKATLWRESTQLPFILHTPGMNKLQDCNRNVNLIDIYPTLIDLCKLPSKKLDGKSIVPLLKNPSLKWTPAITTMDKGNHSIISEKWHYIYIEKKGVEQLYNLEKDPMEYTNLASLKTDEIIAIKKELRAYMPTKNADIVTDKLGAKPKNGGDADAEGKGKSILDTTIKAKRVLSKLK